MRFGPSDSFPAPPHFDPKNVAVGAIVSSLLVGLLGYGTIIFFQAITPGEEGVNIGGALLASLGSLLAVALGAAFRTTSTPTSQPTDARGHRRRAGRLPAGGPRRRLSVLRRPRRPTVGDPEHAALLLPGVGAALAGAALGSLRSNKGQTR